MTGGRPDEHGAHPDSEVPGGEDHASPAGAAADEAVAEVVAEVVEQDIEDVLDAARRERDEYLDMVRRVQADFENYKKRMMRQQTDLLERAAEALVVRMLPVLDAFDAARAHLEAEGSPEGKALLQAAGLLWDTLAKEGLERVGEEGVPFDPTVDEAVEHEPGDGTDDGEPVVTGVLRSGYRYKGKVVRPAMVRVRG
ncbi:MAG: nucleotide exchange factor GrpE [Acidimicrobiales bacterium]